MNLKKKLLKNSRLYVVIDKKVCGKRSILNIVTEIKDKGCDILQFRDKESKKGFILREAGALRKRLLNSKTLFIVNDYLDIAKIVESDGIHLGQADSSIEIARKILGKNKIIGVSCHNLKQAIRAQDRGADYISIGPVFATPTKPEYKAIGLDLTKGIRKKIKIPFFVIGGINENNLSELLSYGIKRVAVCRALCRAKDIPRATRNIRTHLK